MLTIPIYTYFTSLFFPWKNSKVIPNLCAHAPLSKIQSSKGDFLFFWIRRHCRIDASTARFYHFQHKFLDKSFILSIKVISFRDVRYYFVEHNGQCNSSNQVINNYNYNRMYNLFSFVHILRLCFYYELISHI